MNTPAQPEPIPVNVEITPRLVAAIQASTGQKLKPGARVVIIPPPPKHPGQTCHLCGAKDYACQHVPGVPF